jgi:hypothetical protein
VLSADAMLNERIVYDLFSFLADCGGMLIAVLLLGYLVTFAINEIEIEDKLIQAFFSKRASKKIDLR